MVEKESLYIKRILFANKVLLGFDNDAILQLCTYLLTLEDVFHNTDSSLNLFKEMEDDTNKVKYEFNLKMSTDKFCEIMHISQTVHQNELNFFKKILDT